MRFGYTSKFLEFLGGSYAGICNYICTFGLYDQKEVLEKFLDNRNLSLFLI